MKLDEIRILRCGDLIGKAVRSQRWVFELALLVRVYLPIV